MLLFFSRNQMYQMLLLERLKVYYFASGLIELLRIQAFRLCRRKIVNMVGSLGGVISVKSSQV